MSANAEILANQEPQTQEEIDDAMDEAIAAEDWGLIKKLNSLYVWSVATLQHIKNMHGADHVREWKYNTSAADAKFGSDWLDQ